MRPGSAKLQTLTVVGLVAVGAAGLIACDDGVPLSSKAILHRERLMRRYVGDHPGWRMATPDDYTGFVGDTTSTDTTRRGDNPYFASQSSDEKDGPFVATFVRDSMFQVVYYPFGDGTYSAPVPVARATWLREASVTLRGDTVRIGMSRSDVIFDFVRTGANGFRLVNGPASGGHEYDARMKDQAMTVKSGR